MKQVIFPTWAVFYAATGPRDLHPKSNGSPHLFAEPAASDYAHPRWTNLLALSKS